MGCDIHIVPFAEIFACFLVAGFFLFFGLPERSIQGFIMTVVGLLAFMAGFGLLLHVSETAWSAENGVSAPCYGFAENIGIVAIVIPELKLGNVEWHVLGSLRPDDETP